MRPLYRSAAQAVLGPHGHRGLWFDKFCDQWLEVDGAWTMKATKGDRGQQEPRNPKLDWLRAVLDGRPLVGEPEQIQAATRRLMQMVSGTRGSLSVFRTESRFVTGL